MAIRKNTNPRMMDLQPEMQDILRRNGMQAHVVSDGTGYRLVVQGHDSPLLTYDLTERQMLALTDWGTNSANKKAYNVFTSIVGKDFYMPKNFVHTRCELPFRGRDRRPEFHGQPLWRECETMGCRQPICLHPDRFGRFARNQREGSRLG